MLQTAETFAWTEVLTLDDDQLISCVWVAAHVNSMVVLDHQDIFIYFWCGPKTWAMEEDALSLSRKVEFLFPYLCENQKKAVYE